MIGSGNMSRTLPLVRCASCVAAAALLTAYAYTTGGFATLHLMAREAHRSRVRATLRCGESAGLVHISVARADLANIDWLSEDEFRLEGHLFDVVERTETPDSLLLLCFDDVAERELEISFAHHLRTSTTDGGAGPAKPGVPTVPPHRVPQATTPAYVRGPWIHSLVDTEVLPASPLLDKPHPPPRLLTDRVHCS